MNRPYLNREDIEQRLRSDMESTLKQHAVDDTSGLLDALVEDAWFQIEMVLEQKGLRI